MSTTGLHALVRDLSPRYASASKAEKSVLLDYICTLFGVHRKHAIRMLREPDHHPGPCRGRPRTYEAQRIIGPLLAIWKATNLICSKRLAVAVPLWAPAYRDADERPLPPDVLKRLCTLSPATIDRLLAPHRHVSVKIGLATTRPGSLLRKQIPIKTQQWDEWRPGFIEADSVAHCGTSMAGMFVYTIAITDIATGWGEHRAVWGRGETGVVTALQGIEQALPFRLLGFDCDNGSEFLNHHLVKHFLHRKQPVDFTRSRAYHKNDNAHIEEKNWSRVRQWIGYLRFDNPAITQMLDDLYTQEWSVLLNYFLPSVKLMDKQRHGARIVKIHDVPATPCQRLIDSPHISRARKRKLRDIYASLDPFVLQSAVRKKIAAIQQAATRGTM